MAETESRIVAVPKRIIRRLRPYHKRHPDLVVALYCRVSTGPQERRGNLEVQIWKLKRVCAKWGILVLPKIFREPCSGQNLDESRGQLIAACQYAKAYEARTGRHTAVLAVCTDRYVRPEDYNNKTNDEATATEADLLRLEELADGARLLTYLDPDMPLREVKRYSTKWGMQCKGRMGGRPRTRSKDDLKRQAHELFGEGKSFRAIATALKRSVTTVWRWLQNAA